MRHALPGTYKINANFFGTSQQAVQGPVSVQATLITNFGRPNEARKSLTVRLTEAKETVTLGEFVMGK